MDWLKKYYEKVALAAALVVLFGSSAYLYWNVGKLNNEVQSDQRAQSSKGKPIAGINISAYTNALDGLHSPLLWKEMPQDLFPATDYIPKPTTGEDTNKLVKVEPVVTYLELNRRIFKLLFKAYNWDDAKKQGSTFQLNFVDRAKTFFVGQVGNVVSDRFENTGFTITDFEHIITNETNVAIGQRQLDLSRLTIQKGEEAPIVLPVEKVVEAAKPVATIQIRGKTGTRSITSGESFECDGKTYNVIDIDPKQMIIVDPQLPEKHITIPRGAGAL